VSLFLNSGFSESSRTIEYLGWNVSFALESEEDRVNMKMIRIRVMLCLCPLLSWGQDEVRSAPPLSQVACKAVLADGRVLQGVLEEATGKEEWIFSAADQEEKKTLPSREVSRLLFSGPFDGQQFQGTASVHLLNGDTFRGLLLKMTDRELVLDTPYAGKLRLPKEGIRSLVWGLEAGVVFQGPKSLEEWTLYSSVSGRKGWEYENGALYTSTKSMQTVGVELPDFPDRARITFQLQWKDKLQLETSLWADNARKSRENHTLILQEGMFRVKRRTQRGQVHIGTINPSGMEKRGQAEVCLLLNRGEKKIHLFVDEVLLTTFTDTYVAEPALGNALIFRGNPLGLTRIRNLEIRTWDGTVEGDAPADADQFFLKNGDVLSGTVEGIDAETVTFLLGETRVPIPLERLTQIAFRINESVVPELAEEPVSVYLSTEDRLTLHNLSLRDGGLTGVSPYAGSLTLGMGYLQEISFQSDASGTRPDRLPASWQD